MPRELLVPGLEYYIASLTWSSDGRRVPNEKFPKVMGTFMGLSPSDLYENFYFALFSEYRDVSEKGRGYNVSLNDMWRFYPVKKHLIQQAMERRALTQILRNITGDEYFSWP